MDRREGRDRRVECAGSEKTEGVVVENIRSVLCLLQRARAFSYKNKPRMRDGSYNIRRILRFLFGCSLDVDVAASYRCHTPDTGGPDTTAVTPSGQNSRPPRIRTLRTRKGTVLEKGRCQVPKVVLPTFVCSIE